MRCTYLGCTTPATHVVEGDLDRIPWYGCPAHYQAMAKAMGGGRTIDYTVRTTPIRRAAA